MPGMVALEGVSKRYRVYHERYRSLKEIAIHRRMGAWEDHYALRDVDLAVEPGHTLGLIGANGAGKSTALKLMARILTPDRGRVTVRGRASALIELGAGFQLEYTGRENVYLNASLLGLPRREVDRRLDDIVGFAELEDAIDQPTRTYSSGMYMRLAFSVAINVEPDVMLVDEILAVGDEAFQRKCYAWLEGYQAGGGTIVMVSHNLGAIREMCTQVGWIGGGRVLELGRPDAVVAAYLDDVRERMERPPDRPGGPADAPAIELGLVELLGPGGEPVQEVAPGRPLDVRIRYRVNVPTVTTPVFGVQFHRNDGVYVYGTNSHVDAAGLGPATGAGDVTIHFDALPLLTGTYLVTVAAFTSASQNASPVDAHSQRYRLRVVDEGQEQGLVRLAHSWSASRRHPGGSDR